MNPADLPQWPTQVGAIRIDWGTLHIVRDGAPVRITPKAAAVLNQLLTHCDVTVSRRQLFDTVWPDSASADEVLTQVINELRRAFVDNARDARFIATIPKLGYRWTGPAPLSVSADAPDTSAPASKELTSPPRTPRRAWAMVAFSALLICGLGVAIWLTQHGAEKPTVENAQPVRPVTAEPGLNLDPAISRDGQQLAYVHVDADGSQLRVRRIGAGPYATVPLPSGGTPSAPAWSPDGNKLLFVWRDAMRCEIRRVAVDGSDLRSLDTHCPVGTPSSVDWSADGRFVAFSRSDSDAESLGQRNVAIYRADADGGNPLRLSHSQSWLSVDLHPRISTDGKQIAFLRDADAQRRVVLMAADATPERNERALPVPMWPYRVAWGTGDLSLLVAGHGRAPAQIQRLDLTSGVTTTLVAESAGPGLALTPDGRHLIFERRSIDDNIWSVPADDLLGKAQRLTDESGSQLCPRISPNGLQIAYLSDQAGGMEIFLRTLADGETARISSFAPAVPVDLAWSPDGATIAVILGTPQGRRLAVIGADGERTELPPLLRDLDITLVDFSHDAAWLYVVVASNGRHELRRLSFPGFATNELVIDRSIGALSASRREAGLYLVQPRQPRLEWLAPGKVATTELPVLLQAAPADQWLVYDDTLVQMQQMERGSSARLMVSRLDAQSVPLERSIQAPDPPLGRGFDVGAGRLWYANRDRDAADLVEMALVDPAPKTQ